ncbi:TonB-dependent receptor [Tunicatimonas pelagia]|uniref:TonB-dependent receptor n=1 Tax=Tunicatimonas pelagia TaxID=931531 RepID=UPI0026654961|nr:TonB-dependent receptor [Tunicatimonas pelagia]WKN44569.1 TonB-dependent receptor [Tunicatimonas pelagia]
MLRTNHYITARLREATFRLGLSTRVGRRLLSPVSRGRSDGIRWLVVVSLLLLFNLSTVAQTYTVSGYVTDAESGEKLIGASVYLPQLGKGTTTNLYGFYSLPLSGDSATISFSYIGYARRTEAVALIKDTWLDVELSSNTLLEEVEIIASPNETRVERVQMSMHKLEMQTVNQTPVLAGEADILKTLQLLPGVSGGTEGSAGLYVRGGSPDQNLILLDGVPVYNVNHVFGFLSVFNTDAINNVDLYKGGIPARYGGRLSSVLDISMKEGNLKERGGVFAISPIAARFTYESPIKKDTSSFIISTRRTWLDALMAVGSLNNNRTFGFGFHDINAKYNHKINKNNRLYLSFYTGRDRFFDTFDSDTDESTFNFKWGNTTSVLRWNKIYTPQIFSNLSFSYSTYDFFNEYMVEQEEADYYSRNLSRIRDLKLQIDYDYVPALSHHLRFGGFVSQMRFSPEVVQIVNPQTDTTLNQQAIANSLNAEAYIEDEILLSRKLKINAGLRGSLFHVNDKTYSNLQPRLSVLYQVSDRLSFKNSYTYMAQYLHLLTNSSLSVPTDLWVSSTENIAPQYAQQYALGVVRSFANNSLEISLEGYYKAMLQLITYQDGANYLFQNGDSWEEKVVSGDGEAYGVELFIHKKVGKLNGWLGYTLAWSNRWFEELNGGRPFPFRYDRRHDLSLLINYEIPRDRTLSIAFVFNTGNAITLPTARYQSVPPPGWENAVGYYANNSDTRVLLFERPQIDERNNFRMPSYHRLDISYRKNKDTRRDNRRSWIFSLYNAYSRRNPYFIYESKGQLKQYSLFPIIPSVTYRLEF